MRNYNQSVDACISTSGAYSADITETLDTTENAPPQYRFVRTVSDGNEKRVLYALEQPNIGIISRNGPLESKVQPLQLLALGRWSIPKWLSHAHVSLDGAEMIDGRTVVKLIWEADEPDGNGSATRGAYWLSPELGYAVVRDVTSRRPKVDAPWRIIQETESAAFELVSGLYLPGSVSMTSHKYYDDGHYEPDATVNVTFQKWRAPKTLPRTHFTLTFPPGTRISDRIRRRSYTQDAITDSTVESQVHDSQLLAAAHQARLKNAHRSSNTPRVFLPYAVAVIAVVGLVVSAIIFAARRHGGARRKH